MGIVRYKIMVKLNHKGQTMVEYILLLAVSVSLVITFLNSDFVKRMFGTEGKIGQFVKSEAEFAYRHAFLRNRGEDIPRENTNGTAHPSYYQENGETRFFGAKLPYP
jgi:Flp pilus assembly pilin Flp